MYKIHLINRLLDDRESLVEDVRKTFPDTLNRAESVTYQEITNGLMGSAMAEYCQAVEDLAAMIQATENISYFARKINYKAGVVYNLLKKWSSGITIDEFRGFFHIPKLEESDFGGKDDVRKEINSNIDRLVDEFNNIVGLYMELLAHQMAYKHGMSYALRPYASDLPADKIEQKKTEKSGYPVIYANECIASAIGDYNFRGVVQLPDANSEHIKLNALKLSRENNLLRYVMPPYDSKGNLPSCDFLELKCRIVCKMLQALIKNSLSFHNFDDKTTSFYPFYLPLENGKLLEIAPHGEERGN
jgi:hypothetical protein